jgi:hypothetical protein
MFRYFRCTSAAPIVPSIVSRNAKYGMVIIIGYQFDVHMHRQVEKGPDCALCTIISLVPLEECYI